MVPEPSIRSPPSPSIGAETEEWEVSYMAGQGRTEQGLEEEEEEEEGVCSERGRGVEWRGGKRREHRNSIEVRNNNDQ